jgi:hypothetical protein
VKYLEPDWNRPPLERKILAVIDRLETDHTPATYTVIRRGIPVAFLPYSHSAKSAILDALTALVATDMLVRQGEVWSSSARWRYWRAVYRGEKPAVLEEAPDHPTE